jgi:hypothetical protein
MFEETNKYTETTDEKGRLRGSQKWWKLIVLELIILDIFSSFLYCHKRVVAMSKERFKRIKSCLHIVNDKKLAIDVDISRYKKIGKIKWLVNEV